MFDIKPVWIIAVALVFGVSACGPQATVTIDPGQIQVSAAAMVSTMVAAPNTTKKFFEAEFRSEKLVPEKTMQRGKL